MLLVSKLQWAPSGLWSLQTLNPRCYHVFLAVEKTASIDTVGVLLRDFLAKNNMPRSNSYCSATILFWQNSQSENVVIVLK